MAVEDKTSLRLDAAKARLIVRLEKALRAADRLADLAITLNEGINNQRLRVAIRAYVKAARGLDLTPFFIPPTKRD